MLRVGGERAGMLRVRGETRLLRVAGEAGRGWHAPGRGLRRAGWKRLCSTSWRKQPWPRRGSCEQRCSLPSLDETTFIDEASAMRPKHLWPTSGSRYKVWVHHMGYRQPPSRFNSPTLQAGSILRHSKQPVGPDSKLTAAGTYHVCVHLHPGAADRTEAAGRRGACHASKQPGVVLAQPFVLLGRRRGKDVLWEPTASDAAAVAAGAAEAAHQLQLAGPGPRHLAARLGKRPQPGRVNMTMAKCKDLHVWGRECRRCVGKGVQRDCRGRVECRGRVGKGVQTVCGEGSADGGWRECRRCVGGVESV
eukprot:360433-Chlamydomonas_euryale.AAC.14